MDLTAKTRRAQREGHTMPEANDFEVKQKKAPIQLRYRLIRTILFTLLSPFILCAICAVLFVVSAPVCQANNLYDPKYGDLEPKSYTAVELIRILEGKIAEGKIPFTAYTSSGAAASEFECHYSECLLKTLDVDVAIIPSAQCFWMPIETGGARFKFYSESYNISRSRSLDITFDYQIGGSQTYSLSDIRPTMEEVIAQYNNPFMSPDYRLVMRSGSDRWYVKVESPESTVEYEVFYQKINYKGD
jgi:hypothetical protein